MFSYQVLGENKDSLFSVFADFCGENTPMEASFNILKWCQWSLEEFLAIISYELVQSSINKPLIGWLEP